QPTAAANIAPATLTVTGITAGSKVYDGTTAATLVTTGATLVGAIAGDDVGLDSSGATGAFADKNVGTGKTVTVSGLLLTGGDATNSTRVPLSLPADITAAALSVTEIPAADKPFDGTTAATLDPGAAVLVGVVTGDVVTLDTSAAVGTFDTPDVGTN